ncbi:hypothetical protein NEOLI_000882 [Neolecta irregularis DAH-3]|uniref:Myb-like domain-containing protein n=1 Tax=Neolecta irregularis (strain DAH-3) TaxID=1198029 RepID=A0A1U7LSU5_NEOID|nr:hypothetical protein NEOLI_000882 [Neolecta irregularis DAH-3]|eukprot:OLL25699.1 hypothetical protein NEOLI_000882 [Neolecta irregularis DAH-3]
MAAALRAPCIRPLHAAACSRSLPSLAPPRNNIPKPATRNEDRPSGGSAYRHSFFAEKSHPLPHGRSDDPVRTLRGATWSFRDQPHQQSNDDGVGYHNSFSREKSRTTPQQTEHTYGSARIQRNTSWSSTDQRHTPRQSDDDDRVSYRNSFSDARTHNTPQRVETTYSSARIQRNTSWSSADQRHTPRQSDDDRVSYRNSFSDARTHDTPQRVENTYGSARTQRNTSWSSTDQRHTPRQSDEHDRVSYRNSFSDGRVLNRSQRSLSDHTIPSHSAQSEQSSDYQDPADNWRQTRDDFITNPSRFRDSFLKETNTQIHPTSSNTQIETSQNIQEQSPSLEPVGHPIKAKKKQGERSPYGDWKRTGLLDSQYPASSSFSYHPFQNPGEENKKSTDVFAFRDFIRSAKAPADLYSSREYQKCLQLKTSTSGEPMLLPHMIPPRKIKPFNVWSAIHNEIMDVIIDLEECWEKIYPVFKTVWADTIAKKGLSDNSKYQKIPNIGSLCWRFYNLYCSDGTLRKGNKAFSCDEDKSICLAIERYGSATGNWRFICNMVPRRSPNLIWRRYRAKLEPIHHHLQWTKIELDTLLRGIARYGRDFETIRTLYFPFSSANVLQRRWEHKVWSYLPLKTHGLARFYNRETKGVFLHPRHMGIKKYDSGYDTEDHLLQEWELSQEPWAQKQELQEKEEFGVFGDTGIQWWKYDEEPEDDLEDDDDDDESNKTKDIVGYW